VIFIAGKLVLPVRAVNPWPAIDLHTRYLLHLNEAEFDFSRM
jgi:hypothetical protein